MLKALALSILLVASFAIGGCASYQMGDPGHTPYQKVYVGKVANQSGLPQIEGPLITSLRKGILQSGTLELSNRDEADAILEIILQEANRDSEAVQSEDVGRGRKFSINLTFAVSLRDARAPDSYFIRDRVFEISQDVYADSGYVDAEYQGMPNLAQQVADETLNTIVNVWE